MGRGAKASLETLAEGAGGMSVFLEPVEARPRCCCSGRPPFHVRGAAGPPVGFRVCVVDDREEFANARRFPTADRIMVCSVDEAFRRFVVTPATFIAIATRGHAYDRDALQSALATQPAYLGMIGSRRKRDLIYGALMADGVAADDLIAFTALSGLPSVRRPRGDRRQHRRRTHSGQGPGACRAAAAAEIR